MGCGSNGGGEPGADHDEQEDADREYDAEDADNIFGADEVEGSQGDGGSDSEEYDQWDDNASAGYDSQ